jgi:hypothetical protein
VVGVSVIDPPIVKFSPGAPELVNVMLVGPDGVRVSLDPSLVLVSCVLFLKTLMTFRFVPWTL